MLNSFSLIRLPVNGFVFPFISLPVFGSLSVRVIVPIFLLVGGFFFWFGILYSFCVVDIWIGSDQVCGKVDVGRRCFTAT